jgi:hypothetical protein
MKITFLLIGALTLSACGGSPTAPDIALFVQTGTGPATFELPSTVEQIQVEIRGTANSCHYFEIFIAQKLLEGGIIGSCQAASGMSVSKTAAVSDPRVDIRSAQPDHNIQPFVWKIEEVR